MNRIRVIGVGGAGLNTVYRLAKSRLTTADLFGVDVDRHITINPAEFYEKVRAMLTPDHVLIIETGENADIPAEEVVRENREHLLKFIEGADAIVFVCGLGGRAGGPITHAMCRMAEERGLIVATVLIFPLSSEGNTRGAEAIRQAREISDESDIVVMLKNDFLLKVAPKDPINIAFGLFDDAVTWLVAYLRRLIR